MKEVAACFFCTTPYQIIAALCIVNSSHMEADIYILTQFRQAKEVAKRLKKEHIFREVQLIDDDAFREKYLANRSVTELRIKLAYTYFLVNRIVPNYLIPDTRYQEMFVSSQAYIPRLVYLYFHRQKAQTELVFFDDGEGSYDNDLTYAPKQIDTLIRKVIFGRKAVKMVKTRYLYSPKIYYKLHPQMPLIDIRPIENRWREEKFSLLLNRLFGLREEMLIREPVIFVDTLRVPGQNEFDHGIKDINHKIEAILDMMSKHFGKESIIIKKHPRDKYNQDEGYNLFKYNSIPFEALCLNMNMENKVMVVIQSTAAVMPKILMDCEPYVIMLYSILNKEGICKQSDLFFQACASEYRQPNRFFIPQSMEELDGILEMISETLKKQGTDVYE